MIADFVTDFSIHIKADTAVVMNCLRYIKRLLKPILIWLKTLNFFRPEQRDR